MAGPWEEFQQAPGGAGPWTEFQKPENQPTAAGRIMTPVTDIPAEIGRTAGSALKTIGAAIPESLGGSRRPEQEGFFEGLKKTGAAALAVPELLASPVTGAARSLIGHPLGEAIHGAGTIINPQQAAKDKPEELYQAGKEGADLAMMGLGARGMQPRVRIGPGGQSTVVEEAASMLEPGAIPTPSAATKAKTKTPTPALEEIEREAKANYATADAYNVQLHAHPVAQLADQITAQLKAAGFRDYPGMNPATFSAVKELAEPLTEGRNVTMGDFNAIRHVLTNIAIDNRGKTEGAAAYRALQAMEDYLGNLAQTPQHIATNAQNAPAMLQELQAGRGNWRAAKRLEEFEEREYQAANQAASAGTGANYVNTVRQRFKAILNNKKERGRYSEEEIDAMERIVRGTYTGNIARFVGKLAPHGPVSMLPSLGAWSMFGPQGLALPIAAEAGKIIGERSVGRSVRKLEELTRQQSPLGRQQAAAQAQAAAMNPPEYRGSAALLGLGPLYGQQAAGQ